MAKKAKPPEPNLSELPMNNDEAAAVSNLLESAEKALDLGEKELAKLCFKEAGYILRRGKEDPGQLIHLVPPIKSPTQNPGAGPDTKTQPQDQPSMLRPQPLRSPSPEPSPDPSTPAPAAPLELVPPTTTGQ